MKNINDVVTDIYKMIQDIEDGKIVLDKDAVVAAAQEAAIQIATSLVRQVLPRGKRKGRVMYPSNIGKPARQVWYELNGAKRQKMVPHTKIKFMQGDLNEALVLFLTKISGHGVTHEQEPVEIKNEDGEVVIRGYMDCRIDGVVTDVKSTTGYGLKKFEDGLTKEKDSFHYLDQLGAYIPDGEGDVGAFLAVDRQTGKLVVDVHEGNFPTQSGLAARADVRLSMTELPAHCYAPQPEGKSGNMKLCTECSYCPYKVHCYPSVRCFIYSGGRPVYLTDVTREPKVPEVPIDMEE